MIFVHDVRNAHPSMHSFNTGTRNPADIHYRQLLFTDIFHLGTISVPLLGTVAGTHMHSNK